MLEALGVLLPVIAFWCGRYLGRLGEPTATSRRASGGDVITEFSVAYEITRTFTDEELGHDPDPEEVMAILVRQVEHALRTIPKVDYGRLRSADMQGWVSPQQSDGSTEGESQ
jgi:hypothetical protein